jgi:hypothetical protein
MFTDRPLAWREGGPTDLPPAPSFRGLGQLIRSRARIRDRVAGSSYRSHRRRALAPRAQSGKRHSERRVSIWRNGRCHRPARGRSFRNTSPFDAFCHLPAIPCGSLCGGQSALSFLSPPLPPGPFIHGVAAVPPRCACQSPLCFPKPPNYCRAGKRRDGPSTDMACAPGARIALSTAEC